jgi:hypothetical protein
MTTRAMSVWISLLLVALVQGCGVQRQVIKNYEGPVRPTSQLSILKPQLHVKIYAIDGDKSKRFQTWRDFGSIDADIELEARTHTFEVGYEDLLARSRGPQTISFAFREGRRYLLGASLLGDGTWRPQIIDVTDRPELWCITSPKC